MPEMELRWPEAAGFNFLWLQILGYTGWPNNDAERSARLARYFAEQLAGIGTRNDAELKAETSITQFRLERDEADRARALDLEIYRKIMESARDQCLVALEEFGWFRALHSSPANSRFPLREVATTGRVLITVRSIETYHQNKLRSGSGGASLNKAFQVVAKAAGQNKLLIKGEKEVKNVWAQFRNSAHLAASFLLTNKCSGRFCTADRIRLPKERMSEGWQLIRNRKISAGLSRDDLGCRRSPNSTSSVRAYPC
jgi:hypothetical protein